MQAFQLAWLKNKCHNHQLRLDQTLSTMQLSSILLVAPPCMINLKLKSTFVTPAFLQKYVISRQKNSAGITSHVMSYIYISQKSSCNCFQNQSSTEKSVFIDIKIREKALQLSSFYLTTKRPHRPQTMTQTWIT